MGVHIGTTLRMRWIDLRRRRCITVVNCFILQMFFRTAISFCCLVRFLNLHYSALISFIMSAFLPDFSTCPRKFARSDQTSQSQMWLTTAFNDCATSRRFETTDIKQNCYFHVVYRPTWYDTVTDSNRLQCTELGNFSGMHWFQAAAYAPISDHPSGNLIPEFDDENSARYRPILFMSTNMHITELHLNIARFAATRLKFQSARVDTRTVILNKYVYSPKQTENSQQIDRQNRWTIILLILQNIW